MNPKQAIQIAPALVTLAAVAPPLLAGGAIGLGIVLLIKALSGSDKEKQPEATPATPEAEASRKPAESADFRLIPAVIPAKPAPAVPALPVPRPAPVRPLSAPIPPAPRVAIPPAPARPVSVIHAPVPIVAPTVKAVTPASPLPIYKKSVMRADLAAIFDNGARTLSRTAAVTALKRLGFGKTAAYAALSPHGRFSGWLVCAPDGIISWENGRNGEFPAEKEIIPSNSAQ